MPDGEFTVSVPDVHGCSKQLGTLGRGYTTLGDEVSTRYEDAHELVRSKNPYATGPLLGTHASPEGALYEALGMFQGQSDKLLEAHASACGTLGEGLDRTSKTLRQTADSYQRQDEAAAAELRSADPSADAQETADAITDGEPNAEWRAELDVKSLMDTVPTTDAVTLEMSFEPTLESTLEVLGETAEGGLSLGTVDAVVEYFTGVKPSTEAVKPMLCDWGVLWYVADVYGCAAQVVDEISRTVTTGADTLVGDNWTGDAAEKFAGHGKRWHGVLTEHANLLRNSAGVLDDIANKMQEQGVIIGEGLVVVADLAIEIISVIASGGLTALRLIKELGPALAESIGPVMEAVFALQEFLEAAGTSTEGLASDTNSLSPP